MAEEADAAKETDEATEGQEGEGEGSGKKHSKKKIIIFAALAVLLIVGGGAGAYFGGLIGGKKAEGEHAAGGEGAEGAEHTGPATFFDLPELLVNLNSSSRQTSFLKMTVALELSSAADVPIVQANLPRVMDSFNTYLRELRANDLYGSAGIYRLREELLVRVNKDVAPAKVKGILFKQILVQ